MEDYATIGTNAVCSFVFTAGRLMDSNPKLSECSVEEFIESVFKGIHADSYKAAVDQEQYMRLVGDVQKPKAITDLIDSVVEERVPGIAPGDPHLKFAHAWFANVLATQMATSQPIQVDGGAIHALALVCSMYLQKWRDAGYRLDWHPMNRDTEEDGENAPKGCWVAK